MPGLVVFRFAVVTFGFILLSALWNTWWILIPLSAAVLFLWLRVRRSERLSRALSWLRRARDVPALRRAAAGLVLFATSLVCLGIVSYREYAIPPSERHYGLPMGYSFTPGWMVPVAVGLSLSGAALALLVYGSPAGRR